MQKILSVCLIAVLLWWGMSTLANALASDEKKIRWMIEDAVEAFNDGRPKSSVAPLADEWFDTTSGVHRDTLKNAIVAMAFQERGRKAGELAWRLTLEGESLTILVDDDDTATARFDLTLARRRGEEWHDEWAITIDAELVDDDGWEIVKSGHATRSGRRP